MIENNDQIRRKVLRKWLKILSAVEQLKYFTSRDMMEETGITKSSVRRYFRLLEAEGKIEKVREEQKGWNWQGRSGAILWKIRRW
ncbi:MAG: HTH domain-containing protein [FCB group bacterium]|nr:HTH domain-containing protein [FCB group bacterium]